MNTCFVLNYGYEAPLFWPQVSNCILYNFYKIQITNKQVSMTLDDEDSENDLKNVPSTCTIVMIAGKLH